MTAPIGETHDQPRARIVEELRAESDGLDAQTLGERLGLHPNTVRWHLGILGDAGSVESRPAERHTPGRPRILYRLRPGAGADGREEYRLLATILTGAVASMPGGSDAAEEAGRAWGRYLVPKPLPLVRMSEQQATKEVAALLGEQGFAPERAGRAIRMRRCPFLELAETSPDVVCAVHRGLVDGALEELGGDLEVEGLDVLVEPDLCVLRLTPRRRRPLTQVR